MVKEPHGRENLEKPGTQPVQEPFEPIEGGGSARAQKKGKKRGGFIPTSQFGVAVANTAKGNPKKRTLFKRGKDFLERTPADDPGERVLLEGEIVQEAFPVVNTQAAFSKSTTRKEGRGKTRQKEPFKKTWGGAEKRPRQDTSLAEYDGGV